MQMTNVVVSVLRRYRRLVSVSAIYVSCSVYRHFGPKTLRTFQTSDLGHFGMSEVSQHFSTDAEMSFGQFGTILAGLYSLVVTA